MIIDNYDSFTYNLYQCIGEILTDTGNEFLIDVIRNDKLTVNQIADKKYDRIIISPGPGNPENPLYFGVCKEVLSRLGKEIPILGVCLGMQGMALSFGGRVLKSNKPMHGKTSEIIHDGKGVFFQIPKNIEVMRYHSLVVDRNSLPQVLKISAQTINSKEIMGLRHLTYPIEGIQFHPESFATEGGNQMLKNFIFSRL